MTTYVVMTLSSEEMGLAETVQRLPDAYCYVEQNAMSPTDSTIHLWFSCAEDADIAAALEADTSVSEYEHIQTTDDEHLYAVTVEQEILLPREIVHQHDGAITKAYGGADEWTLEARFPFRADFSAASDAFERYGIDVMYQSIESAGAPDEQMDPLTDAQRDVLETAIEMGYFEIPREATLQEVAEELDVSHQALSERLRRAHRSLAENNLVDADEQSPPRLTE